MPATTSYKRGQLVWALWQTLGDTSSDAPAVFKTRIRKFTELGVPIPAREKIGSSGFDLAYTDEHAFALGVALMLQDMGFKQSEAAFLVKRRAALFADAYQIITANPPAPGARILGRDRPGGPRQIVLADGDDSSGLSDPNRRAFADTSVYLTFRFVELRERWPHLDIDQEDWDGQGPPPVFMEPKIHRGLAELLVEMERLAGSAHDPMRTVIELSNMAASLRTYLGQAPEIRRGRK